MNAKLLAIFDCRNSRVHKHNCWISSLNFYENFIAMRSNSEKRILFGVLGKMLAWFYHTFLTFLLLRILFTFDWQLMDLILLKVGNAIELNASSGEASTTEMGIWVKNYWKY